MTKIDFTTLPVMREKVELHMTRNGKTILCEVITAKQAAEIAAMLEGQATIHNNKTER